MIKMKIGDRRINRKRRNYRRRQESEVIGFVTLHLLTKSNLGLKGIHENVYLACA